MNEIPEYYTILFQAAEQAIQALEQQNYGLAKQILIDGERGGVIPPPHFGSILA